MIGCAGCDKVDSNDLVSCTSLGGINIRMLLLGICNPSEYIYILRPTFTAQQLAFVAQLVRAPGITGPWVQFLPEDLVLHFRSRSWSDLKMYMYSLGLQTLTTAF